MRRVPSTVGALAFTLAIGCGTFVDASSPADTPDAAPVGPVGGPSDAGDGGTADVADAAPTPFCAGSTHTFCEDFDPFVDGGRVKPWWTNLGVVAQTTARSRSAPTSMIGSLPERASGTPGVNAAIARTIEGPWRRTIVAFDVYLEGPAWREGDRNVGLFCLGLYADTGEAGGPCLSVGKTGTATGMGGKDAPPEPPLPYDQWLHVKADVDPATGVTIQVGDVIMLRATLSKPLVAGTNPTMVLQIGLIGYNSPAPAFTGYFDNIAIDLP